MDKESKPTTDEANATTAPQLLDFSQLNTENDKGDQFFANHKEKEEDDFFTPSDVTLASPTAVDESEYETPQAGSTTTPMEPDAQVQSVNTGDLEDGINGNEEPRIPELTPNGPETSGENKLTIKNNGDGGNRQDQAEDIQELQVTATIEKVPSAEEAEESRGQNANTYAEYEVAGVDTNGAVTDREEFAIGIENTATEVTAGEKEVVEENQVKDSIPADAAAPSINQLESEASAVAPNHDNKKPSKKKDFKITVPQPFKFHEGRPKVENADKNPEYKFKARPVPKKVFEGPKDVKIKAKLTKMATEPNLKSEERARARTEKELAPIMSSDNASSKTSTHTSTSSINKIKSLKPRTPKKVFPPSPTKIKPFSFAERDSELQRKKQMKLQEKLEQDFKTFKFVAKPVPSFRSKLTKTTDSESTTGLKGKVAEAVQTGSRKW